jgi:hypothetical protein
MAKMMRCSAGALLSAALAGAVALLPGALAQDEIGKEDALLFARIDRRAQAWQPTPEERRLDDVAWARDLRDALRLAREHGRPVFLFTYNGSPDRANAIALQRC